MSMPENADFPNVASPNGPGGCVAGLPAARARSRVGEACWLSAGLAGLYLALSILIAWRHEAWRDEAQAWLIVRDTGGLAAVLGRMGYEGTPALWHLLLYPLARVGLPLFSMQLVHSLLAFAAIALLVRHAPFPWFLKLLLPFGYHAFYQYGIVARSYVLVGLFLFALGALHAARFRKPYVYGLCLALLSNSCVHAALLALVLAGIYFFEFGVWQSGWRRRDFYLAGGLVAVGFLAVFIQVRQPPDLGVWAKWNLTLGKGTLALVPRVLDGAFWPMIDLGGGAGPATAGLGLLAVTVVGLGLCPRALVAWGAGLLLVWAVFQVKHAGDIWHYGLIYMFFVYCAWTAVSGDVAGAHRDSGWRAVWRRRLAVAALTVAAAIQLVGGWRAARMDYRYAFSGGKETAEFLRRYGVGRGSTLVATCVSYTGASVLAHIPDLTRTFFAAETGAYYSFMKWDRTWADSQGKPLGELVRTVTAEKQRGRYERLLFLLSFEIRDPRFLREFPLIHVAPAGPVMVGDERFFVHEWRAPVVGPRR